MTNVTCTNKLCRFNDHGRLYIGCKFNTITIGDGGICKEFEPIDKNDV